MHRKVVTVLFCDVVGSTSLGESIDPEALQGLLARYFERMKAIVESHEGTVEKFIGDAVMAVFGVPQVHEDDALRACRAAVEMRDAFPELGLQGRIGVNTGEVVTGTEERLAAGDAVNVAARFQNAADPGEVLIGEATLELVAGAVESEAVEPLELKGKAEPVPAHRLVAVLDAPERSHASRFVGREHEVELIRAAWQRATAEQRCELVTVVGDAGIGKSRLVAEALAGIRPVVRGRCLPYGEGITYWPVVEVLKQLDALPSDPAASASLRSLLGETDQATSAEEIAWAFRKLLEEQAPLVAVFDDIHWAEETFLDLLEAVGLLSTGSPLLVVCVARPELAARRTEWPVSLRLEPLTEGSVDELLGGLPAELHQRVARAAGGNPLFLIEMLAMADEDAEVDVPPTLRALLAARLDQLDPPERRILERGSVEGELFHRGAVQMLTPDEEQVTPRLAALTRKELIRPDRAQLPGDDGFRFRHLLIRDAAYDALPKATRADLHERFADWLEERGADLVELNEILGYHLERAASYRAEFGQDAAALADRAGNRLAAAGRTALWRGDTQAAAGLLTRALELTRPRILDVALELDLAAALEGDAPRAAAIAQAAADRAKDTGDDAADALGRFAAAFYRMHFEDFDLDELEHLARVAIPLLERDGVHGGLVHTWLMLGGAVLNWEGRSEEWIDASEQARLHSRLAGQRTTNLFGLEGALVYGAHPADEALTMLDGRLPENPHPRPLLRRAWLLAMLGRHEEASELARASAERWRELSDTASVDTALGDIASTTGHHHAAAAHWSRACAIYERGAHHYFLATYSGALGRALCLIGRYEEAEDRTRLSRATCAEGDIFAQMLWRQAQALLDAHRGEYAKAEALAREAVALGEPTEWLNFRADAMCDLAEVLAAAGRTDEAAAALEEALVLCERKKNLAMVAQVQPRLDALRAKMLT